MYEYVNSDKQRTGKLTISEHGDVRYDGKIGYCFIGGTPYRNDILLSSGKIIPTFLGSDKNV